MGRVVRLAGATHQRVSRPANARGQPQRDLLLRARIGLRRALRQPEVLGKGLEARSAGGTGVLRCAKAGGHARTLEERSRLSNLRSHFVRALAPMRAACMLSRCVTSSCTAWGNWGNC